MDEKEKYEVEKNQSMGKQWGGRGVRKVRETLVIGTTQRGTVLRGGRAIPLEPWGNSLTKKDNPS